MNKKLLLGIIAIFMSILAVQAQQSRYGFRAGLNYSDIDFEEDISGLTSGNDDARIGFTAGFFAQYYLSEKFSIQPELQYSAQGERTEITQQGERTEITQGERTEINGDRLAINVLQLPVLLNLHIGKLALSVGPQIGLSIWEWERENDYEFFQFSGVGGVTYDILDNFQATLRGSFGITDAIQSNSDSLFSGSGANHYLQFTLAYRL